MRHVYLDHLSTTPLSPQVFEAMRPYFFEAFGNPSSLHQHGLHARDALNHSRQQITSLINAESTDEILFTSCGTEAANLAIKGVAYANQRRGTHIVVSAIEHPALLNSVQALEKQGFTCTKLPVDSCGLINANDVQAAITDKTILVAVHHVNHDIGTIQPIREIGLITGEKGVPLLVDASTSGGWLPIDVQAMGATLLTLSPHRFYGPKGVGVLYRNRRARLMSLIHGGDQENGRRAGTENVPAIVGAGLAAEVSAREIAFRLEHTALLQKRIWKNLEARIPFIRLNGPEPGLHRITTSLNVSTEFIEGEGQLLLLDTRGIAVASGSSCVSKSLKASHVLSAIGLDNALAQGSLILSVGQETSIEDVDYFIEMFEGVVTKLRAMSPTWDDFQHGKIDSMIRPRVPVSNSGNPAVVESSRKN